MHIVEFFGPPGSGKSYFKKKLIKKFFFKILDYKTLYNIISDRNLFLRLYYSFIKLPYLQKIKNNYFILKIKKILYGLIKIKNLEYNKSIKAESKLVTKIKFIKNLIERSQFSNNDKKNFENWANEEIHANHYAKNKFNDKKILIDSEGLIQRLFIYCYKKKNKKQVIKKYLNLIEMPQIVILFDKRRVNKKNGFRKEESEEKKIFKLVLWELEKKNISIINSKIGINKAYLKIKKKLKL